MFTTNARDLAAGIRNRSTRQGKGQSVSAAPGIERGPRLLLELVSSRGRPKTEVQLAVTKDDVERCFLADTGLRVGEWRRRLRLFHALRLLETGASIATIAFECGYASASAFTAAFTRHFGTPPTRRAVTPRTSDAFDTAQRSRNRLR